MCLAVAPPPVPATPIYVRRFFVLFELKRPADILKYGVREYIVYKMTGRPIGGLIYRSTLPDYGQCIIIRASGTHESLDLFENDILTITDDSGNTFWEYTKAYRPDESLRNLPSYNFTIGQSNYGAKRGPNSDPKHDNQSEKSSQTGKSSKSGNSMH